MEIKGLLTDALKIDADASLSKTISLMGNSKKKDAIILKDGKFHGMVSAKDILKKQIGNPDEFKIESLSRKVSIGDSNRSVEEIAGMMLAGDYSDMPFMGDELKTLPKNVVIKALGKEVFAGKSARDVMSVPYFVSNDDNIASVKHMLLDLNVSKIPVIDDDNKIVGVVDSLNLLTTITKRTRQHAGELSGEKKNPDGVNVSSFMDKELTVVSEDESLQGVVDKISKNGSSCILVENNGMLSGIITPKDILKLVGKTTDELYMNLSGYLPEDKMDAEHVKEIAKKTLNKLQKKVRIRYAVMHIERHGKKSVKSQYSVSARLGTHIGLFVADNTDWDLLSCVKKVMDKIFSSVERDMDKRRTFRRIKE